MAKTGNGTPDLLEALCQAAVEQVPKVNSQDIVDALCSRRQ